LAGLIVLNESGWRANKMRASSGGYIMATSGSETSGGHYC